MSATEEKAWEKIYGSPVKVGRTGIVPIFHLGTWMLIHNTHTIWPNLEFAADPKKVDKLRENVNSLMEAYPDTVPQLEKLGVRVKSILKRTIDEPVDVEAWANSIFNTGPVTGDLPYIEDAKALAYDDFIIEVKGGRHPIYVLPVAPRGSGNGGTVDYSVPGAKTRYGARHDFSKLAFSQQVSEALRDRTERSTAPDTNGAVRPRGRPRKDGLVPGSPEAKEADETKRTLLEAERAAKRALKNGNVQTEPLLPPTTEVDVEVPPARRRLVRVGAVSP